MVSFYELKAEKPKGETYNFDALKGKVVLIVNTASKCGFTPQFEELEELNKKYGEKGLVVLGFPCNQFANQDPADDEGIGAFCKKNYGVTFDVMAKTDVNGNNTSTLSMLHRLIRGSERQRLILLPSDPQMKYSSSSKRRSLACWVRKASSGTLQSSSSARMARSSSDTRLRSSPARLHPRSKNCFRLDCVLVPYLYVSRIPVNMLID